MATEREKALEKEVQELQTQLGNERARHMNTEYEMLKRIYPYLANENDHMRQQLEKLQQFVSIEDADSEAGGGNVT